MSVFKRGKRWYLAFMIRGRRFREAIPEARTKADAQRAETRAREDVYAGRFGSRRAPEFAAYCTKVFEPWITNNHETHVTTLYRLGVVKRFFGKKKLDQITLIEAEKYKKKRLAENMSAVTINKELKLLKQALRQAVDNGLLQTHPLQRLKYLREAPTRQRVLTSDEEQRLLAACPVGYSDNLTSLRYAIIIALTTGARQGEIYRLRVQDIDRQRLTLFIEKAKNGKSRTIPIPLCLVELLEAIEPAKDGRILKGHFYKELWYKATVERAGIEDIRFHDMRHAAATRMAGAGVDPFTIQAILGHSSLKMTALYTHITSDRSRLATEVLASSLPQAAFSPSGTSDGTLDISMFKMRKMAKTEVA